MINDFEGKIDLKNKMYFKVNIKSEKYVIQRRFQTTKVDSWVEHAESDELVRIAGFLGSADDRSRP